MTHDPRLGLQLRSHLKSDGELEVSLVRVEVPTPGPDEVLVRVGAAPINPSDLGLLFGPADLSTARASGTDELPALIARVPDKALRGLAARVGQSLPVGNEGAGEVVAAGDSPAAQALIGKTVALVGGAMYAQYRCVRAEECLALPEGVTAVEGASAFINPLTALGMVETMRREGHTALVHTAAASSLGQMLQRLCHKDGIALVNVVRTPEQVALLKSQGAAYALDSSAPTFMAELTDALAATGATLGFDATGGGKLAGQILTCMESALNRTAKEYSRYGSSTHKQVYIYGGLDPSPTELTRGFGMAWGLGGWLVFPYLRKIGREGTEALKKRVAAEIKTTFATRYSHEVSLTEMLRLETAKGYAKPTTGAKYLIVPNR